VIIQKTVIMWNWSRFLLFS